MPHKSKKNPDKKVESPKPEENNQEQKSKDDEIASLKDQLLRAMAELENLRKRSQRDLEESAKYAITNFARDMTNVLENLYRAEENIPEEKKTEDEAYNNISQGIALTKNELLSIFEKYGIARLDPKGEKFDHNFHQAVSQVEDPDSKPGTVVHVIQAGYTIKNRLLRPAMVAVAKE